jgi:hypothetical protein
VVQGRVAAQVVMTDWAQTQLTTTWSTSQSVEDSAHHLQVLLIEPGTALAGLVGVPVGSRVLLLVAQDADGEPLAQPTAAVIDIVTQM